MTNEELAEKQRKVTSALQDKLLLHIQEDKQYQYLLEAVRMSVDVTAKLSDNPPYGLVEMY
jgi:hypothetical protein